MCTQHLRWHRWDEGGKQEGGDGTRERCSLLSRFLTSVPGLPTVPNLRSEPLNKAYSVPGHAAPLHLSACLTCPQLSTWSYDQSLLAPPDRSSVTAELTFPRWRTPSIHAHHLDHNLNTAPTSPCSDLLQNWQHHVTAGWMGSGTSPVYAIQDSYGPSTVPGIQSEVGEENKKEKKVRKPTTKEL